MITHELKCHKIFFQRSWSGSKRFEIRYNDRDFQTGDNIVLKEIDDDGKETGRRISMVITYILSSYSGLKDNYVILSVQNLSWINDNESNSSDKKL